jgi:hypothetical protein
LEVVVGSYFPRIGAAAKSIVYWHSLHTNAKQPNDEGFGFLFLRSRSDPPRMLSCMFQPDSEPQAEQDGRTLCSCIHFAVAFFCLLVIDMNPPCFRGYVGEEVGCNSWRATRDRRSPLPAAEVY